MLVLVIDCKHILSLHTGSDSVKMDINRLHKDEAVYELVVRGWEVTDTDTVDEMRRSLRGLLLRERSGGSIRRPLEHPFSFEEDRLAVQNGLDEVDRLVSEFQDKYLSVLSHLMGRADLMVCTDDAQKEVRNRFLKCLNWTV